jgi:hypothetical protein
VADMWGIKGATEDAQAAMTLPSGLHEVNQLAGLRRTPPESVA